MKRMWLAMTLLALAMIFSGSAPAQTFPPGFDHFLCYYVPNQPVLNIPLTLADQFDTENTTQVQLWQLCNPVYKTVGSTTYPPANLNHHLTMYQLNPQLIIPRQVQYTNQFGANQTLYTSDGRVVALPTVKWIPPNSPPPASTDLDHYKCYVASGPNANKVVLLTDQFITNVAFLVVQPVLFCNPVKKTNGSAITPIQFPNEHLTCYALTRYPFTKPNVNIFNQFIPSLQGLNITVNNPDMLCAPTYKLGWNEVPPPPPPPATSSAAARSSGAAKANKP